MSSNRNPLSAPSRQHARHQAAWNQRIKHLRSFIASENRLPTPQDGALGKWLQQVVWYYHTSDKNTCDPQRLHDLESLPGWTWIQGTWGEHYQSLKSHLEQTDDLTLIRSNSKLGKWIRRQQQRHSEERLPEWQVTALDNLTGWVWKMPPSPHHNSRSFIERELLWRIKSILVQPARSGRVQVDQEFWSCDIMIPDLKVAIEYDGYHWHKQPARIEHDLKKNTALVSAGWTLLHVRERPLPKIAANDILVEQPVSLNTLATEVLEFLVSKGGTLKRPLLTTIDVVPGEFRVSYDVWYEGFERLKDYKAEHGHAAVPASFVCEDGYRLGQWVYCQRRDKKRERLSDHKVNLLDSLEFQWVLMKQVKLGWDEAYSRLVSYADAHERLPFARYRCEEDGFSLGAWVSSQRSLRRRGRLSLARQKRLEVIPQWAWEMRG